MSDELNKEIAKRRTFAIISHPDAGKTTLTEKLLLFGGAIHVAGAVKSNKIKKTATSDWMEIEKQRGISVATSVMGFNYGDYKINILDTPGHQDFAEDTFRTLTAVDSVIIVVDVAKGVETQTRRLMEVRKQSQGLSLEGLHVKPIMSNQLKQNQLLSCHIFSHSTKKRPLSPWSHLSSLFLYYLT